MKRYVLGFLMDVNYVALIRKNRPEWQAGLLNGIGGHIEDGETELQAMIREFKEEAGLDIIDWKRFAVMSGGEDGGWEVTCFHALGIISKCKSQTDEEIEIRHAPDLSFYRGALPPDCIENIPWLLAMIQSQKRDNVEYYHIRYVR